MTFSTFLSLMHMELDYMQPATIAHTITAKHCGSTDGSPISPCQISNSIPSSLFSILFFSFFKKITMLSAFPHKPNYILHIINNVFLCTLGLVLYWIKNSFVTKLANFIYSHMRYKLGCNRC